MKLEDFEKFVEQQILERGFDYYKNNKVLNLEKIGNNFWFATVKGSKNYHVKSLLRNGSIVRYECNCPYDFGAVCKHEVALWFALRNKLGLGKITDPSARFEVMKKDIEAGDIDVLRQFVRDSLRLAKDRHGFIDYWSGGLAIKGAEDLLKLAKKLLLKNNLEKVFQICQVIIEELVPALQDADDSNGEIGSAIETAFEVLNKASQQKIKEPLRLKLIKYCAKQGLSKKFEDWDDWKWSYIKIASQIITDNKEKAILFVTIDKMLKDLKDRAKGYFNDEIDLKDANEIKLDLIKRFDGNKKAHEFIYENLQNSNMRILAIDEALAKKDWRLAESLAQGGIEQDTNRGYLGLVVDWLEKLLLIAELQNKRTDQIIYSRELFIKTGDFKYYEKLKKLFSKKEWKIEVDKLIIDCQGSSNTRVGFFEFGGIFIREKEWSRLLHMINNNELTFEILDHFHKYLFEIYPKELSAFYEKMVIKELDGYCIGREIYKQVCRMLRRMIKLGDSKRVGLLVGEIKIKYKNRRALLDELSRL